MSMNELAVMAMAGFDFLPDRTFVPPVTFCTGAITEHSIEEKAGYLMKMMYAMGIKLNHDDYCRFISNDALPTAPNKQGKTVSTGKIWTKEEILEQHIKPVIRKLKSMER